MTQPLASKLKVLITRPEEKGRALALQLNKRGIEAFCHVFFDYEPRATKPYICEQVQQCADVIVIFVSVAAVIYAHKTYPISHWHNKYFIAVGDATKLALAALTTQTILCPKIHTSEGVLALPILQQVSNKNIIIVRGDGGREYLKDTLEARKAKVTYIESYQKVWRTLSKNIVKKWQAQQINCIVVTSNALLEQIMRLLDAFIETNATNDKSQNDTLRYVLHLKNTCLWVVASKRIADNAQRLGLVHIVNANGANDQAIMASLQTTVSFSQ